MYEYLGTNPIECLSDAFDGLSANVEVARDPSSHHSTEPCYGVCRGAEAEKCYDVARLLRAERVQCSRKAQRYVQGAVSGESISSIIGEDDLPPLRLTGTHIEIADGNARREPDHDAASATKEEIGTGVGSTSRTEETLREKRGAGAGCTTPFRVMNDCLVCK